ncbi:MAG: hypothetical protein SNJ67_10490 [Chloracidobacterium sp.]|uniref:Lipoprotein n=1 Tax=Chloracidobacterium validum TaxID=2821543 RepID=A0ABX8BDV6_9BACT|nr:hypothetical protein [Chloracidobacterium validum]QUW04592.1 hypothetical protein J8C06_12475 [Chloracidobacterium validum]
MVKQPSSGRASAGRARYGLWLAVLWLALVIPGGWPAAQAETRPSTDCFSLADLPPEQRTRAEALFLAILDSEALYTVAGDLKPMSSGYVRFQFDVAAPDLGEIETTRTLLAHFRCGDRFYADVLTFAAIHDGKRYAEGVVFNRAALRRAVGVHAGYFAPLGITPNAHPMDMLNKVEHADRSARWRGYGYLFGYPDAAVDFFVAAGETQAATGKFVERDFMHIPTYARDTGAFTWAVAKGHRATEEEERLRTRAMAILEDYRKRRAEFIGDGKPGVIELLRALTAPAQAKPARVARHSS